MIPRLLAVLREPFYRNSASIIANSFLNTLFGLVFWIVAAHIVPSGEIGLAIATISAAAFLTSLSRLGMDDVLVRFMPGAAYRPALYGSVMTITLLLALAFTGAFLLLVGRLAPSLGYLREGWYLPLFIFYMVTVTVYTTQDTALQAVRRADLALVQDVLLGVRVPLVLLIGSLGAAGILLSFNLAYLAALLLGGACLMRLGLRSNIRGPKSVVPMVRGHIGYSLGNYASTIFTMMPSTLVPIVIMDTTGARDVAYFYVAYAIAAMLFIIPNAVSMSLFIEGSHDMPVADYTRKSLKLILAVIVPLIVVLLLFGDRLLLLFNREYAYQSIGLLRLLVVASAFSLVSSVYASIRKIEKNTRSLNVASALTAVLIVGLGCVFLSAYGLTGLGYAWILAYAIMAVILGAVLLREGKIFPVRKAEEARATDQE